MLAGSRRIAASAAEEHVAAKRARTEGTGEASCTRKLLRRESSSKANVAFMKSMNQHRYRNLKLNNEYDTHDPDAQKHLELPFLKRRSKVVEIVAAKDIVFALTHSGICAAFSRQTNKRMCFLNVRSDEVIRSLFYNKNNDSLITVSVYGQDNFSSLKCRSTPMEYIRRRNPADGFTLFEKESLRWPGFVEFDDVNGKVLTYSAQDQVYKVFDLKNYNHLYSISDKDVQEIKISPGIMLLIYERKGNQVPLEVMSIEDGKKLKSFNHLLAKSKKLEFIEQFNEKLLVKQEGMCLQIVDICTTEIIHVAKFLTPDAFIFLYENQLFLTFKKNTVQVWNFKGDLVTSFDDHELRYRGCNTNNIYITSEQDHIISYCQDGSQNDSESFAVGSINISNIHTGKRIAKITRENGIERQLFKSDISDNNEKVTRALKDVTSLFYDEERNEIFTGSRSGLVHVWAH